MAALEIILLLIGVILLIGSFFVAERLSPSEVQKMAELSEEEIKRILEKRLEAADKRIESTIDDAIDGSLDKVERSLDKETNEKIMAISEYSDTVMTDMNKTHDEIMFLYSMLNDRHSEMTEMAGDLKDLIGQADEAKREAKAESIPAPSPAPTPAAHAAAAVQPEPVPPEEAPASLLFRENAPEEAENTAPPAGNHNERILELANQGRSAVEIAKELSLGVGEVQLVMGLSKRPRGGSL